MLPAEDYNVAEHQQPIKQVLERSESWETYGPGYVKLWMPILKEEACNACHGYDASSVRGVLHVEVSTVDAEKHIAEVRKMSWLTAIFIALLIGVILWWLLNKIILKPVTSLSRALEDLGQIDSKFELPVTRKDELGDVARSFKILEQHWEDREARLSLILNNIPEAVVTVDENGNIQTVNKAAQFMFGYEEEEMLKLNMLKLLGPVNVSTDAEDKTLTNIKVKDMNETSRECVGFHHEKGVFPVELEVISLEGSFLMFISDIDLLDVEVSKKYLFFLRDMSVRRRAEADMQILATVVDQASEAILISDPEGTIEYINSAFTETTGFTADEVLGKNPNIIKSDDRGQEYYQKMWQTLKSGEVWRDVFVNKRKDGTLFQAEQRIAPLHDSFGNISHFVSIQRDITKEKGLQEQVEHLQRLESLGVLAGGIAHDFNNILACIVGNAEVLSLDLPDNSLLHDHVKFIKDAGVRGERLCLELMAYAGKGKRHIEPINLSTAVTDIANILETTTSKQINLTVQLDDSVPDIMADHTQLEQVVMNLVINATEAMKDGKGTVSISTSVVHVDDTWFKNCSFHSEKVEDGEYVCLRVADNGMGMNDVTVNQIFDPFFTTKFTGRGLGMSAVLGIIQNHHGSLKCESTVDVGTTFSIIFPRLEQDYQQQKTSEVSTEPLLFKGEGRVVVIDDEMDVCKVVASLLERMGYQVTMFNDAREALKVMPEMEVVAVMVDMSMPLMDGPSFVKAFRESNQQTPVIICSGDAREDVISRIDESLVNDFISKPFRYKNLVESFSKLT